MCHPFQGYATLSLIIDNLKEISTVQWPKSDAYIHLCTLEPLIMYIFRHFWRTNVVRRCRKKFGISLTIEDIFVIYH